MRLPRPAAGTMPHMISGPFQHADRRGRALQRCYELASAVLGGMFAERSSARRISDAAKLGVGQLERGKHVVGASRHQDILAGRKERIETFPVICDDSCAAGGR